MWESNRPNPAQRGLRALRAGHGAAHGVGSGPGGPAASSIGQRGAAGKAPASAWCARLGPILGGALLALSSLLPSAAMALELSVSDRLALLYSPQLRFTETGEPLIRVGIVEAEEAVTLRAERGVSLQPLGPGGPVVEVPGAVTFRVRIEGGRPGAYRYAVVVSAWGPTEREGVMAERRRWEERGHEVELLQLGSVFSLGGNRFDTRRTLVALAAPTERSAAEALVATIQDDYGVDARLHAELVDFPTGSIVVEGLPGRALLRHRDLLWVRPLGEGTLVVEDVAYDRGTRFENRETRRYVGALLFTADRDGMLAVVNELPMERMLEGIVPAEIFTSAPEHALRAQAVAARSELLADLGVRHLSEPWMTCADQRCQVYRGIDHEHARTSAAVRATRGHVLSDGERVINAFFSSNNGGFSANNASTWGGEARSYLPARYDGPRVPPHFREGLTSEALVRRFLTEAQDGYANITTFGSGRHFRWEVTLDRSALQRAVDARYPDLGALRDVEILERDRSGRVTRMRLTGRTRSVVVERELNVRRALGGLRSALFVMEVVRQGGAEGEILELRLVGGGFGHGVGLCQTGAMGAAERGMTWQAILAHYYPGTALRALY